MAISKEKWHEMEQASTAFLRKASFRFNREENTLTATCPTEKFFPRFDFLLMAAGDVLEDNPLGVPTAKQLSYIPAEDQWEAIHEVTLKIPEKMDGRIIFYLHGEQIFEIDTREE